MNCFHRQFVLIFFVALLSLPAFAVSTDSSTKVTGGTTSSNRVVIAKGHRRMRTELQPKVVVVTPQKVNMNNPRDWQMLLCRFFLGLSVILFLSFLIYLIWLIVHLFFCREQSGQASSVHKPRISRVILRTLLFFWFSLCGSGLALGYLILSGFAKAMGGMSAVPIPDPSQFQKNVEHWGLALIFMPVFLGIITSLTVKSRKTAILGGAVAYVFFVGGLLLLGIFDNSQISLEEAVKGLEASAIVAFCFIPVHLGWFGLAYLFPKAPHPPPPPPITEHPKPS